MIHPPPADDEEPLDIPYSVLQTMEAAIRPTTLEELHHHVEHCYGYDFPTVAVCEGHVSPMQVLWEIFSDAFSHLLVIGSRESGKTLIFAFAEHLIARWNGDEVFHGAGIYAQAKRCFAYIQGLVQNKERPWFSDETTKCVEDEVQLRGPGGDGKIEIKSATLEQVNGPHPRAVFLDEVELIEMKVLDEAASMPKRVGERPPVLHYTSSLKKPYGPMVQFLEEKDVRGLTERRFCVFEVMEECKPARHQNGVGCQTCPLAGACLNKIIDKNGTTITLPGPGKATRSRGWMRIDDVIAKMRLMSEQVFRSQWLSLEPQIDGLIYPMFNYSVHVVDYPWNPNLPVYAGVDFGFHNPSVVLYAQQLYDDSLVFFAEDYQAGRTDGQLAAAIKAAPWFPNIAWIAADPAGAGARATLAEDGVPTFAADNDVAAGIDDVRWGLRPADPSIAPKIYFDFHLVNTISEIKKYHKPKDKIERNPDEKPQKIDDHAMDAMRYLARYIFRGRSVAP